MKLYVPQEFRSNEEKIRQEEAKTILDIAKKYDIKIVDDVLEADFVIPVGGDGTTLHWSRKILKDYNVCKPILPIRTASPRSMGYLADIPITNVDEAIKRLSKEEYKVHKRHILDFYKNDEKTNFAIADITIMQVPREAMRCTLRVDNKLWFHYKSIPGDGITVATSTGTTGYNESAGGHVLDAADPVQSKQIVVTLRYPIYLRTPEVRSKVLSENSVIDFEFYRPYKSFVVADTEFSEILKSDKITIKKSDEKTFNLVKINGMEESKQSKDRRRIEFFERALFENTSVV